MVEQQSSGGSSDERHARVLLERLEPKVDLVLEGQKDLTRMLDRVEVRMDEQQNELNTLRKWMMGGFKKVYEDIEKIDRRFAAHEQAHAS